MNTAFIAYRTSTLSALAALPPVPARTVTERALLARVNRVLSKEDWPATVRKCRTGAREYEELGAFYETDTYRNFVIGCHVDLKARARELGVMAENEALVG